MKIKTQYLLIYFILVIILSIFKFPIINEIFSFIFYSIVPGFLIYNLIMKKKKLSNLDFYLSISLSLLFIMVCMILLNSFGHLFGSSTPLSFLNILITINIAIAILFVLNFLTNKKEVEIKFGKINKNICFISLCGILLTLAGLLVLNYYKNQILMWLSTIFVIGTIIYLTIRNKNLSENTIKILIFTVSLILLLSTSMISTHVVGWDIHREQAVFEDTHTNQDWNLMPLKDIMSSQRINQYESYNANPSITLLPTFYANIFNLPNNEYIFKFFFQIFAALIPLILFDLFRKNFSKICATVGAIFIIVQYPFFQVLPSLIRQEIAYLFFVSLFLLLFTDTKNKIPLAAMLFLGILISHYTTMIIALVFLVVAYILYAISGRLIKKEIIQEKYIFFSNRNILIFLSSIAALTIIWFVLIPTNLWYIYKTFARILFRLQSIFLLELQVASGIGIEKLDLVSRIGSIIGNLTRIFIIIGFLKIVYDFLKSKFRIDVKNIIFYIISFLLILSLIIFPSIALDYNINRLYLNVLFFLAPLFLVGIAFTFRKKNKVKLTIALILIILHFSFQAGLISYFVSEDNHPFFDTNGDNYEYHAISDSDVYAMQFLGNNTNNNEGVLLNGLNEHNKVSQYLSDLKPEKIYYKEYASSLWENTYYYNDRYSLREFDYEFESETKNNLVYSNPYSKIFFFWEE